MTGSSDAVSRGEGLYGEFCSRCHGLNVGVSNVVRDLRYMSDGTHQIFERIVLDGIYSGLGMVSFADHITAEEVADIHHYLIQAANDTWEHQHSNGWWHDVTESIYRLTGDLIGEVMGPPVQ